MAAKKTKKTKPAPKKKGVVTKKTTKKLAAKKPAPKKLAAKKPAPKKPAKSKPVAAKKPLVSKKSGNHGDTEARFWSMIESAWAEQSPEVNALRASLSKRTPGSDPDTTDVDDALDEVLAHLREAFESLPKDELATMDGVLERKLYDLDRAEVQEVTDGSDDGFLYARGYVVALGRDFYDAVMDDPQMAITDAECEEMCYLPATIHEERFGGFPESGSKLSRETGSNAAGWANG